MDEKLADAIISTITMYQMAFKSFLKENDNDIVLARDLTNSWWQGVMTMTGLVNRKGDNPKWM